MADANPSADRATPGATPVRPADEVELDRLVADRDLVLVAFHTAGCGICASMEPVLGNVARATGATVALVNPRDDPPLVERFAIRSVPTLVLFAGGERVGRIARGFVPTADLVAFVESRGEAPGLDGDPPAGEVDGGSTTEDGTGSPDTTGGTPLDREG